MYKPFNSLVETVEESVNKQIRRFIFYFKKKKTLTVKTDLSDIFNAKQECKVMQGYPVEKVLAAVLRQMKVAGLRERTISI